MAFSRRQFLKLAGGAGAGAAILAACRPGVREFLAQSPAKLPEDLVSGVDNWYASLCDECGAGCGIIARVIEGRVKKIEGNPKHPINAGKTCVRGQASVQALYHPDRIRRPMKAVGPRGSGQLQEITWDEAMDTLLGRLRELKGAGQGNTVVLATDPVNGHLGLVVSRFAKAYGAIHAPFEPMDQAVLRAAVERLFGADLIPDFDLQHARSLLSFGADFLMGWVSQVRHSRGYGEFRQGPGRERGAFVHVDSRFSGTAASADEWVAAKPGSEGKLALSIAYVIVREGLGDRQAATALFGPEPRAALDAYAPERVAQATGVAPARIERIAKEFATQQPGIAIGGGSAAAHTNGLFNLTAILALNHLVGNVGKRGGVILNPAPPLDSAPLFKDTPFARYTVTPLNGWRELTDRMRAGKVNAFLVRNADPVHGLPGALDIGAALERVPFIASFSTFLDDTTFQADLVLPTHVPLEDWGDRAPNPGPGHQVIGFQQPVVRPFLETRGFGDLLLALAQELGLEGELPWATFRDVLREGAQRLQQLNRGNVSGASFEAYWNNLLQQGGWWDTAARADGRVSVPRLDLGKPEPEFAGSEGEYPYVLVPFASHALSDGRAAHLPWLQAAPDPITTVTWETWVEMNAKEAKDRGLREGDMLRLESSSGALEAALYPNLALPRGVLAIPVGQGHRASGRYAEGRGANPLAILSPLAERETGSLAWAATRVRFVDTGRRVRIPKMEGAVLPIDFDRNVKITRG